MTAVVCCFDIFCQMFWSRCCSLPCCNLKCPCCRTTQCDDWAFMCPCQCQPNIDEDFEVGQNTGNSHHDDDDIVPLSSPRQASKAVRVYTCKDMDDVCYKCLMCIYCKKCCKRSDSKTLEPLSEDYIESLCPSPQTDKRQSNLSKVDPSNEQTLDNRNSSLRGSKQKQESLKASSNAKAGTIRMHDILQYQESVDEENICQNITIEAIVEQPAMYIKRPTITEESEDVPSSTEWKVQELKAVSEDGDSPENQDREDCDKCDDQNADENETMITSNRPKLAKSMDSVEFNKILSNSDSSDQEGVGEDIVIVDRRPKNRNSREEFSDVRLSGISIIVTDYDVEENVLNWNYTCTSLESLTDSNVGSENSNDSETETGRKNSRKVSLQDFISNNEDDGFTVVDIEETKNVRVSEHFQQTAV